MTLMQRNFITRKKVNYIGGIFMMKLLGGIIVIAAATSIGFVYSRIYTERVKQLRDLQYALNILESEIIYTSSPLIDALLSASQKSSTSAGKLLSSMSELLGSRNAESIYDAFNSAYDSVKSELFLEKEEIDVLGSFVQSIGSADIEGQKKNFNITLKKLEGFEKSAEETRNKNEKLYRYLGLCAGVLIVIVLV
jgi:stage III sporulation protein AB